MFWKKKPTDDADQTAVEGFFGAEPVDEAHADSVSELEAPSIANPEEEAPSDEGVAVDETAEELTSSAESAPEPDASAESETGAESEAADEPGTAVEPTADPGLTGSIEALESTEQVPAELDAAGVSTDATPTTVLPAVGGLTDAEAAALAASTLPAAAPPAVPAMVDLAPPEGIDMGPERRGRWWLWALIGLLVLGIAAGVGYYWWWSTSRPISVPDVVGKQAAEATQIFNDVALRLGEVSEVATDAAPQGFILSQNPEAGTRLKPGERVSFVVALPPTQSKVPDVNGKLAEDAQVELAKAKLRPVMVESFATTVAAGYVVAQLPGAEFELPPGAPVAVVVSKGPVPSTVGVPRLSGMLEADAGKLLAAYDLKSIVYRSYDPSITAGTVITQSPANGVAAPYESYVQVLVSQGPGTGTIVVPTVTGQSRASATKELKDKGLKAQSRTVSHATVPKGQVVYQMPPPGRRATSGSTVGLLISRGNTADAMVPSLEGTASANVELAAADAGFRAVIVNVPTGAYAPGTVFMQFPLPGSSLTRGLPIVCIVAMPVPAAAVTTAPAPSASGTPTSGLMPTLTP